MGSIKLEAGKYYRTRGGWKAFVASKNPFGNQPADYAFVGLIDRDRGVASWDEKGFFTPTRLSHPSDLIAEWKEPKRIKGWMNVWDGLHDDLRGTVLEHGEAFPGTNIFPTKAEADESAANAAEWSSNKRLACIEIDVLEGQGLDGSAR